MSTRICTKCAICSHCAHTNIFKDHSFELCTKGYNHKGKCSNHGQNLKLKVPIPTKEKETVEQKTNRIENNCCVVI